MALLGSMAQTPALAGRRHMAKANAQQMLHAPARAAASGKNAGVSRTEMSAFMGAQLSGSRIASRSATSRGSAQAVYAIKVSQLSRKLNLVYLRREPGRMRGRPGRPSHRVSRWPT